MDKHFTMQGAESNIDLQSDEEKSYYMSLVAFQDDNGNISIQ
ncbi:hypothetical protein [Paenibacillus agilis]|nr:hypothetical protein [Paenibacillus agilis]